MKPFPEIVLILARAVIAGDKSAMPAFHDSLLENGYVLSGFLEKHLKCGSECVLAGYIAQRHYVGYDGLGRFYDESGQSG